MNESKIKTLGRVLATTEFRGLSPHLQAIKLVTELGASVRVAGSVTGLSKSAVDRAIKSSRDLHPLGLRGGHPALGEAQLKEFHEALLESNEKHEELNFAEAGKLVSQL